MWQTYTPDGRSLIIRLVDGSWVATCGPTRVEAATPAEAIRGAIGDQSGEIGGDAGSLESWIEEHAAELEAAAGL